MKRLSIYILLTFCGCSTVHIVGVERDPAFTLNNYKTFGFHEIGVGGSGLDPNYQTNLNLLKEAIARELLKKGLTRTQGNPDMAVNIGAAIETKDQTRELNFSNPGDRGMMYMGQRNYSWNADEVVVGQYRDGSIKVDLVDRAANKMVWTGTAESVLPTKAHNVPKLIDEAMLKLFEQL
jgi:hypothetical protein